MAALKTAEHRAKEKKDRARATVDGEGQMRLSTASTEAGSETKKKPHTCGISARMRTRLRSSMYNAGSAERRLSFHTRAPRRALRRRRRSLRDRLAPDAPRPLRRVRHAPGNRRGSDGADVDLVAVGGASDLRHGVCAARRLSAHRRLRSRPVDQ